ncbi:MAG: YqaE/Pmp3 family membrane protein [Bacteroidetes bacterium]|nr:YqaE/Pmp3 family membrane protein [Bacteroidota bacterium]
MSSKGKFFKKNANRVYSAKAVQSNVSGGTDQLLLCIIAIFIPPLAVFLNNGIGSEFWIDLILTLCFFVPGLIYALYLILK